MRRRSRDNKTMDEINLTSLLDLTFVLLIAFMIVAPALRPQLEVDVPEVPEESAQPGQDDVNSVIVTIAPGEEPDGDPRLLVDTFDTGEKKKSLTGYDGLRRLLTERMIRSPETSVSIQIDGKVPSEAFVKVIGVCQAAGVEKVNIPVETSRD